MNRQEINDRRARLSNFSRSVKSSKDQTKLFSLDHWILSPNRISQTISCWRGSFSEIQSIIADRWPNIPIALNQLATTSTSFTNFFLLSFPANTRAGTTTFVGFLRSSTITVQNLDYRFQVTQIIKPTIIIYVRRWEELVVVLRLQVFARYCKIRERACMARQKRGERSIGTAECLRQRRERWKAS